MRRRARRDASGKRDATGLRHKPKCGAAKAISVERRPETDRPTHRQTGPSTSAFESSTTMLPAYLTAIPGVDTPPPAAVGGGARGSPVSPHAQQPPTPHIPTPSQAPQQQPQSLLARSLQQGNHNAQRPQLHHGPHTRHPSVSVPASPVVPRSASVKHPMSAQPASSALDFRSLLQDLDSSIAATGTTMNAAAAGPAAGAGGVVVGSVNSDNVSSGGAGRTFARTDYNDENNNGEDDDDEGRGDESEQDEDNEAGSLSESSLSEKNATVEPNSLLHPDAQKQTRDASLRSSVAGTMEALTLEDFDDADGAAEVLERYIAKKSRYSQMLSGKPHAAMAPPVKAASKPESKAEKLGIGTAKVAPLDVGVTKQALLKERIELEDEEEADEIPLYKLHTLKRKSVSSPANNDSSDNIASSPRPPPSIPAPVAPAPKERKASKTTIQQSLAMANLKKLKTRIYITDTAVHKTIVLTSLMTADAVVELMINRFHLEQSPQWTLFELDNENGLERPLRDWEIVLDVVAAWEDPDRPEKDGGNAILMKTYNFRSTIMTSSIVGRYPTIQGYIYMETRPRKWVRRFCILRDGCLFYKESKYAAEQLILKFTSFDVYTLSGAPPHKTPTPFIFAMRTTVARGIWENHSQSVRFMCVEKQGRLYDWVVALRLAKNELTYREFPELFDECDDLPARKNHPGGHSAAASPIVPTGRLVSPITTRFTPAANTLLGKSIDAAAATATTTTPTPTSGKPLLSFSGGGNYQTRDTAAVPIPRTPLPTHTNDAESQPQTPMCPPTHTKPLLSFSNANYQTRDAALPLPSTTTPTTTTTPRDRERRANDAYDETAYRNAMLDADSRWEAEQLRVEREMEDARAKPGALSLPSPPLPPPTTTTAAQQQQSTATAGTVKRQKSASRKTKEGSMAALGRKPLLDLGDVINCAVCGCSEFKGHKSKEGYCTNCFHVHKS